LVVGGSEGGVVGKVGDVPGVPGFFLLYSAVLLQLISKLVMIAIASAIRMLKNFTCSPIKQ